MHNLNEKARKEEEEEKVRADWMFAAMVTTLIYSKLCLEKTVVLCGGRKDGTLSTRLSLFERSLLYILYFTLLYFTLLYFLYFLSHPGD